MIILLLQIHKLLVEFHGFSWPQSFSRTFQDWKIPFINSTTIRNAWEQSAELYSYNYEPLFKHTIYKHMVNRTTRAQLWLLCSSSTLRWDFHLDWLIAIKCWNNEPLYNATNVCSKTSIINCAAMKSITVTQDLDADHLQYRQQQHQL